MARFSFLLLTAAMAACLAPAAGAFDLDVAWQIFDYPPMYIPAGPMAGQGIMDRQLRLVVERLPMMHHKLAEVTFARAWHEIEYQDAACILGVRKTPEREKIARFSLPFSISGGNLLVMRADRDLGLAGEDGAIELARLAERADLHGGYAGRRSYGEEVGRFLQDPARRALMEPVPTEGQLFRLLQAQRIDFIFSYASELDYYRLSGGDTVRLRALPVRGEEAAVENYIACSDKAAGRLVIEEIDRLLLDREFLASLQAPRENWARLTSTR